MADQIITFGAAFDPSGVSRGVAEANRRFTELAAHGKRAETAFNQASTTTSRFSAKGLATIQALNAATKQTSSAMQRLAADVRLAEADFRAGRISAQDFGTAIQFAQRSALGMRARGIVPAGADLGRFNTIMRSTAQVSQPVVRGLGTVRSSLGSLAAMSLGVKGTLGTLGSALGFMTFGNLGTIGVFAGLAGVAALIRKIGDRARESGKAIADFIKEQQQAAIGRLPLTAQLGLTADEAATRITQQRGIVGREEGRVRSQVQVGAARGIALGARGPVSIAEITDAQRDDKKVGEARKELARLLGIEAGLKRELVDATEEELDATLKAIGLEARIEAALRERAEQLEALGKMRPEVAGPGVLPGTRGSRLVAAMITTDTRQAQAQKGGLASILEPLSTSAQERVSDVLAAEKRLAAERTKATLAAAKETQQLWGAVISGAGSLIQSLIRGDASAGAVIGGLGATIGGAVSIGNPLLGMGIGVASGILGALFGGRKEPLPVRDDGSRNAIIALQRKIEALEARRPKQITNQFFGPGTDARAQRAAIAGAERQSALGPVPLLP